MWSSKLIGMLYRDYRRDPWLQLLYQQAGGALDTLDAEIAALHANRFFRSLTWALPLRERELGIRPKTAQSIDDRRAAVEAKWKTSGKVDVALLQAIADSWRNGEVSVGFAAGRIHLQFVGAYGVPNDMDTLLDAIGDARPAHLPIDYSLRYLLIKDIHKVMTLGDMERPLSHFAFRRGSE